MDRRAYIPEIMQLGDVKVYYWKNDADREYHIEVFRVKENGTEVSELRPGDLQNAAVLLRRVEAAISTGQVNSWVRAPSPAPLSPVLSAQKTARQVPFLERKFATVDSQVAEKGP